jgi:hypothetical protein
MSETQVTLREPVYVRWNSWLMKRFGVFLFLSIIIIIVGSILDLLSHFRGWTSNEEGVFTPAHYVLYAGIMMACGTLGLPVASSRWLRKPLSSILPKGYEWVYWAVVFFPIGVVGDVVWHSIFGVEVGLEALASPTHILLQVAIYITLISPVLAMVANNPKGTRLSWIKEPLGLFATIAVVVFTFMLFWFAQSGPMSHQWQIPDLVMGGGLRIEQQHADYLKANISDQLKEYSFTVGMTATLFTSLVTMALFTTIGRRFVLPTGFWPVLLFFQTAQHALLLYQQPELLIVMVVLGIVAEIVLRLIDFNRNLTRLTIGAFALLYIIHLGPAILAQMDARNWWSPHLLFGLPMLAGMVGVFWILGSHIWERVVQYGDSVQ